MTDQPSLSTIDYGYTAVSDSPIKTTAITSAGTTIPRVAGHDPLGELAERIHKANQRFGKAFADWISVVGEQLKQARISLARKGSGNFERWCSDEIGWSPQYVRKLISAHETIERIRRTETIVSVLPSSESQCRELAKAPEELRVKAWQAAVAMAQETGKPPSANSVKQAVRNVSGPPRGERSMDRYIDVYRCG
ncbi:hypothetical protein Enr13x_32740 [Stieleria neptunia]|uniref:DUF3102 domain-containing protein n=2 Tax=Stieleria neptunia TaxID=2527979 RepID=A0A518HRK5_9BACT|nr:hypothetical protein Enr13x_32740 [Stieleria neptunia]